MIEVRIPSPLRSYTNGQSSMRVAGSTVDAVLNNLDVFCPGIRFRMIDEQERIRQHIKFYVNNDPTAEMSRPLKTGDTLHIICALSGG